MSVFMVIPFPIRSGKSWTFNLDSTTCHYHYYLLAFLELVKFNVKQGQIVSVASVGLSHNLPRVILLWQILHLRLQSLGYVSWCSIWLVCLFHQSTSVTRSLVECNLTEPQGFFLTWLLVLLPLYLSLFISSRRCSCSNQLSALLFRTCFAQASLHSVGESCETMTIGHRDFKY